jgi:hypothetical protein
LSRSKIYGNIVIAADEALEWRAQTAAFLAFLNREMSYQLQRVGRQ